MELENRPLEGEHDCRFGLPLEAGSTDDDREVGAPGLPLVADSGLSESVVLKLGGASSEKPGISDGFHGLDFTVGVAHLCTGCFDVRGAGLVIEVVLTEGADMLGALDGLLVGVEDLAVDLDKGVEDLDGTVDLAAGTVVLVADTVVLAAETAGLAAETAGLAAETAGLAAETAGLAAETAGLAAETAGLAAETVGLAAETAGLVVEAVVFIVATMVLVEGKVAREVGVEGLNDFEAVFNIERPVGVAGLDPEFIEGGPLLFPLLEEPNPGKEAGCLDTELLLPVGSD
ncbi:hypothetical protein Lal_00024531 [Lupinus albus]|nr:hypothetical protein Lal_00024531 [Lupinus albus]